MKTITIDGNNFNTLETFFDEINTKLFTKPEHLKVLTANLDAFNDSLNDIETPCTIVWASSSKSRADLGYPETAKRFEQMIKTVHPTNVEYFSNRLLEAKNNRGETLFELLVDIFNDEHHRGKIFLQLR